MQNSEGPEIPRIPEFEVIVLRNKKGVRLYKATKGSAGSDVFYTGNDYFLKPMEIKLFQVGIRLIMTSNMMAQIVSRSGLSMKGVFVINAPGIIDSDYKGEIKVILCNISKEDVLITHNQRIAQIIFVRTTEPEIRYQEIFKDEEDFKDFDDQSERGDNGFGSTG